jgi:hypothetical protein
MNGRDFLPLAVDLAAGSSEAAWRTSISRAYYATFHVARELLRALRFRVPRADKAHNYLYERLNNCGLPIVESAARDLNALRFSRNDADYEERLTIPVHLASKELAKARPSSTLSTTLHRPNARRFATP